MYIIAGEFKGRRIKTPKGEKTRPTSAILRKAVFDICKAEIGDTYFLDLFAGSGAMGLEALSRGAAHATFVDIDKNAIRCIKENIAAFKVEKQTDVLMGDVLDVLKKLEKRKKQFNIIYIDPPYDLSFLLTDILYFLDKSSLLQNSTIFIEEAIPSALSGILSLKNLNLKNTRHFGKSLLHQYYSV